MHASDLRHVSSRGAEKLLRPVHFGVRSSWMRHVFGFDEGVEFFGG